MVPDLSRRASLLVAVTCLVVSSTFLFSSSAAGLSVPPSRLGSSSLSPAIASVAAPAHGLPSTCGQAKVPLGTAGNFRVLAGSTVTNTGPTVVRGNLGVSPGSAVTGFPPGRVTGSIDKADTAAAHAQKDLVKAYNDAMGRSNCAKTVAGNIGGRTLSPGLYHSSSSLMISSGDLTLDAHGHSGAVFIFQVTTKFTTTSGRDVILSGGAEARNIYWVVGSSATLGTTSVVYGDILAHKSISFANGAKLYGRALAHIGAVTFADDKVTQSVQGVPHAAAHPTLLPIAKNLPGSGRSVTTGAPSYSTPLVGRLT
jgi:Ice-binding-like